MIKKKDLSQEDIKAWENYIKDPSDIFDKEQKNQKNIRKKRFEFDLHGFTLEQANSKVRDIITFCIENIQYKSTRKMLYRYIII